MIHKRCKLDYMQCSWHLRDARLGVAAEVEDSSFAMVANPMASPAMQNPAVGPEAEAGRNRGDPASGAAVAEPASGAAVAEAGACLLHPAAWEDHRAAAQECIVVADPCLLRGTSAGRLRTEGGH